MSLITPINQSHYLGRSVIFVLLLFLVSACFSGREKAEGEILLSEVVYEENGIYYKLSAPNTKKTYTGVTKSYYDSTGVLKGEVGVLDGLPDGAWNYYKEDGTKDYTLFFDNGTLITSEEYAYKLKKDKKIKGETKLENIIFHSSHCASECCVFQRSYYFLADKRVIKKDLISSYDLDTKIGTWLIKDNLVEMSFTDFYGGVCDGAIIGHDDNGCQNPPICNRYRSIHKTISEKEVLAVNDILKEKDKLKVNDSQNYNWITLQEPYYIEAAELVELSKAELKIKRNEIFARYGYIFKSEDLREHFSKMTWYKPLYSDVTVFLTEMDKKNISLFSKLEKEQKE